MIIVGVRRQVVQALNPDIMLTVNYVHIPHMEDCSSWQIMPQYCIMLQHMLTCHSEDGVPASKDAEHWNSAVASAVDSAEVTRRLDLLAAQGNAA